MLWYGDSISISTNTVYRGTQALKIHGESGSGNESTAARIEGVGPFDISGCDFSCVVYWDGPRSAGSWYKVFVEFEDANGNYDEYAGLVISTCDTWRHVSLAFNGTSKAVDYTSVEDIQITAYTGDVTTDVYIDEIRATPKPDNYPGRVLFTFDDNRESVYTEAFPVMQRYGISGTIAFMADPYNDDGTVDNGYMTLDQLRELQAYGWDFILHPQVGGNPMTEKSKNEQESDFRETLNFMYENGLGPEPTPIIYPLGEYNQNTLELVSKYCTLGFDSEARGDLTAPLVGACDYTIPRTTGNDPSTATTVIDDAAARQRGAHLVYHTIGPSGDISTNDFETVVSKAASTPIPTETVSELRRRTGL